MKTALTISTLSIAIIFALWSPFDIGQTPVHAQEQQAISEPLGGGPSQTLPADEMSDAQRQSIMDQIETNRRMLEQAGKLGRPSPEVVALSWPLRKAAGVTDFDIDAISNFVDQNTAFPNQLRDWNCGTRTYDGQGYNHRGIDIFTWPFPWRMMDEDSVEIVAAAPGTIVLKSDGNFDRNCAMNGNDWNAVYVQHSDGSVAWYGHMKNGSLTSKPIGSTVIAGEKLGIVGSSGSSTGPHLHFELYNASGQLQDPYEGPCNTLNSFTWWASQPAYDVPRINNLMTGSGAPVFPTCPTTETKNEKRFFKSGETVFASAYYRDQPAGVQTAYSILRPDGSVFSNWSHSSTQTYLASYWYWSRVLPANAPRGVWRFTATFNGTPYERTFIVNGTPQFDYDGDGKTDHSVFRPSNGAWYLQRSTAGFQGIQFGASGDKLAPADYDGDGKTDIAIYRPSSGTWYILRSSTGTVMYPVFGSAEDLPAPGDYDGDGKADLNVFRPSQGTWYRQNSSTGGFFGFQFGANGDLPTVGDFDGDGKNDLAIFRPSLGDWYHIRSSNGSVFGERFGQNGDKIAPADYDGDGKADLAIFRPSTGLWVVRNSATATYSYSVFGTTADVPISGDYDGDGKADIGVFRPSNGIWYVRRSSNGQFMSLPWGQNGDIPTPSAFGN